MGTEKKISELIEKQGWSRDTVADLLRDYIANQCDDDALLDYLQTRAAETPTAAEHISQLIHDALEQGELDEEGQRLLAIQVLPGCECLLDNDGQYVIYTGQYPQGELGVDNHAADE
jgi:hypothetical protein